MITMIPLVSCKAMRAVVPIAVGLIGGLLGGCSAKDATFSTQHEIIRQSDDLSRMYLEASVTEARECLEKDAKLLEAATILEPGGRASLLSVTYFRLYSLEKRCGNDIAAKAKLIKARYWRLAAAELAGTKQGDAVSQIEQLSNERILDEVDQFDKNHNNGAPAKYIRSLGHAAAGN